MRSGTRAATVAGYFYPADPQELESSVRGYLADAPASGEPPKALIVPHAGHVYSGPIAASGYRLVPASIERVVLLGPAHRYPLRGLAAHSAATFQTPLGEIELDGEAIERILKLPQVRSIDAAHEGEHSLEVHLPFLQLVIDDFRLVPLVVGDADADEVAEVLETLWGGPETLIVISSDLSHFLPYSMAQRIDRTTADAITTLQPERIGPQEACGCHAIGGLLRVALKRGLRAEIIDLRNSGDTAGSHDRVVGYGTFAFR